MKKLLKPQPKDIILGIYLSQVRVGKYVIGEWSKFGSCHSWHYRPTNYSTHFEATLNNGVKISRDLKSDLRIAIAEACKDGIWGEWEKPE